jgi:hypothetical protein
MADQNALLRLIADAGGPVSASALCVSMGTKPPIERRNPARKRVIEALGRLMRKKLVMPGNRRNNNEGVEPYYELTVAGRAFVSAGKTVTSGPAGPLTGQRRLAPDGLRARFWNALRIKKKATVADIVEAAWRPDDCLHARAIDNARHYLHALVRAGIVVKMAVRDPGYAPTSNGFVRFALVRDLGPDAPVTSKAHVFDPNARAKIPYAVQPTTPTKKKG